MTKKIEKERYMYQKIIDMEKGEDGVYKIRKTKLLVMIQIQDQ